jgi:hypothetical protein
VDPLEDRTVPTAVALLGAEDPSWVDDVRDKLLATGQFASVSEVDVRFSTPTLADLENYDGVLVWNDYAFADPVILGNNLADYVDAGHGVVVATFANANSFFPPLLGRWATGGYDAITPSNYSGSTPLTLGAIAQPGHPIMAGVTNFSGGIASWHSLGPVSPGSSLVASWSNGSPLVAERSGVDVGLNFLPPSSDIYFNLWDSSTQGGLLMANALTYVSTFGAHAVSPAYGDVVFTPPTDFVVAFNSAYDPATVDASDLTVNGVPADSVTLTDANTLAFHFATTPVTSQGLQSIHVADGAVASLNSGEGVRELNASFRYDAVLMQVTSTAPAAGSTVLLPVTTLDLNFNEPFDPASAQASDFTVNQGNVVAVTPVDADTLRLILSGVVAEGTLNLGMPAGAMTDVYGNPGAAFASSYKLDFGTVPYPTPLLPQNPAGSLIHTGSQVGFIDPAGDTDTFSVLVDPGQRITLDVKAAGTLQPAVDLYRVDDTGPTLVGSATAAAAGQEAVLQNVPTVGQIGVMGPGPTKFLVVVRGAGDTTGAFTVRMILDASVENEAHGGATNDTWPTAQSLEPSFLTFNAGVGTTQLGSYPGSAAVLGRHDAFTASTVFAAGFEDGDDGFTVDNTPPNDYYLPGQWHLSTGRGAQPEHTASHSFYYGRGEGANGGGTFSLGEFKPTTGSIVSPSITLPTGGALKFDFNYVLQTRGFPDDVDFATVSIDNGSGWTLLTTIGRNAESSSWRDSDLIDLTAYAGQAVRLKWSFDTVRGPVGRGPEGWYVDDVRIRQFLPVPDYYSFNLRAGETATLALRGTLPGVSVTLENAAGATVATGVSTTNAHSLIADYTAPAAGTYYARVVGTNMDGTDYTLAVTRNVSFNAEPNDTLATAQNLAAPQVAGQQWALGHVSGNVSLLDLSGSPVTGSGTLIGDKITLGIQSDGSFILGPTGIQFLGNEFVQEGSPLAGFTISRDGVNFTNKGAIGISNIPVTLELVSSGNFHGLKATGIVGGNLRLERVIGFRDGDEFVTIATRLTNIGGAPENNVAWLENLDPDQGEPTTGDFATSNDVVLGGELVRGSAVTPDFPDGLTIGLGSGDPRRVVSADGFDNDDPFAIINNPQDPNGAIADIAINMAFNYGTLAPGAAVSSVGIMTFGRSPVEADATYAAHRAGTSLADPDVYKVSVSALSTVTAQTMTPGGNTGQFANDLDPMVRIYNASGVPVASDDNSAPDGRNAKASYKVPKGAGGIYYIEVVASPATAQPTAGEYILTVKGAAPPAGGAHALSIAPAAATKLTAAARSLLGEAERLWRQAGFDTSLLGKLDIRVADLGGGTLGLASGPTIWLDASAAGFGWFVDHTPRNDSEFTRAGNQGEQGRIDLLTVLFYEVGHLLGAVPGLDGVTINTLGPGVRRKPGDLVA